MHPKIVLIHILRNHFEEIDELIIEKMIREYDLHDMSNNDFCELYDNLLTVQG